MASTKPVVLSLYRRCLKTTLDWTIDRGMWRIQAVNIRSYFEANRHVQDPRIIEQLLIGTEEQLEKHKHPDPFIPPEAPGGSKYERNMPPPLLDPPPKGVFDDLTSNPGRNEKHWGF